MCKLRRGVDKGHRSQIWDESGPALQWSQSQLFLHKLCNAFRLFSLLCNSVHLCSHATVTTVTTIPTHFDVIIIVVTFFTMFLLMDCSDWECRHRKVLLSSSRWKSTWHPKHVRSCGEAGDFNDVTLAWKDGLLLTLKSESVDDSKQPVF